MQKSGGEDRLVGKYGTTCQAGYREGCDLHAAVQDTMSSSSGPEDSSRCVPVS
jgi:hypothetical protein